MYTIQNYVLSKEIIINTKISDLPSFSLTSPKSFSQTQKPISNVPQDLIDFFARKSKTGKDINICLPTTVNDD